MLLKLNWNTWPTSLSSLPKTVVNVVFRFMAKWLQRTKLWILEIILNNLISENNHKIFLSPSVPLRVASERGLWVLLGSVVGTRAALHVPHQRAGKHCTRCNEYISSSQYEELYLELITTVFISLLLSRQWVKMLPVSWSSTTTQTWRRRRVWSWWWLRWTPSL